EIRLRAEGFNDSPELLTLRQFEVRRHNLDCFRRARFEPQVSCPVRKMRDFFEQERTLFFSRIIRAFAIRVRFGTRAVSRDWERGTQELRVPGRTPQGKRPADVSVQGLENPRIRDSGRNVLAQKKEIAAK